MKRSHIIALSGISCALALICVVGSIFVEFMTLTFAVLSAICVSIPLTQNYWVGGMLSYISTSIFGFLIGNINALPFIIFFGAYAIIQWIIEQKLYPLIKNKMVRFSACYLIKIAYLEAVIAVFWFLFNTLIPTFTLFGKTIKLTYLIIALAGIPIFLLYDLMMHLLFKNFVILINRAVRKASKTTTPDDIVYNSDEINKNNNQKEFDIFGSKASNREYEQTNDSKITSVDSDNSLNNDIKNLSDKDDNDTTNSSNEISNVSKEDK